MVYPPASEDAIELLKLFAFFHRQQIKFEILIQAVLNPGLEADAEKKAQSQAANPTKIRRSWGQSGRELALRLYGVIAKLGERPILPKLCATR